MTVTIDEHRLGKLRWIVLTGPQRDGCSVINPKEVPSNRPSAAARYPT
jgi:hypothetical protein